MALLPNGYDPQNLNDVLQQSASSQTAGMTDDYIQKRKRAVASQAAGGRLNSGVANYPLTDLDTEYTRGVSGVQDKLATSLAAVPQEDWLNQQDFTRSYNLASLIGKLNKPSTLSEVFQGIGSVAPLAAMTASFL